MSHEGLRDAVIEFLFLYYPCMLEDDVLVEGLVCFAHRVWDAAAQEERERQQKRIREVSSC